MNIPQHYIPETLTKNDRLKQKKQIKNSRKNYSEKKYVIRDKLDSFISKPSKHIVDLKRAYPDIHRLKNLQDLSKKFKIPISSLQTIINKGRGAYYSSGSRPNQTPDSWAYARLASTLLGRNACKVDSHVFKNTDITCDLLKQKYNNNSKKYPKKTYCSPSSKPFPIIRDNVMISKFKDCSNPIKAVKDGIKHYNNNQINKIYGKNFGVSSLKAMGLIPRSNGLYDINSKTKPYCNNYLKYYA